MNWVKENRNQLAENNYVRISVLFNKKFYLFNPVSFFQDVTYSENWSCATVTCVSRSIFYM